MYLTDEFPTTILVEHAVPQGPILRPILFIMRINDLPFNLSRPNNSQYFLFADDLSLCI